MLKYFPKAKVSKKILLLDKISSQTNETTKDHHDINHNTSISHSSTETENISVTTAINKSDALLPHWPPSFTVSLVLDVPSFPRNGVPPSIAQVCYNCGYGSLLCSTVHVT